VYNGAGVAKLDARLAAINAQAMAGSRAFDAGLGQVQELARAASGSRIESEEWSTALVRLADLTSHHSNTQLALAELDRLSANAELAARAPTENASIAQLRDKLAKEVGEQARLLDQINTQPVR